LAEQENTQKRRPSQQYRALPHSIRKMYQVLVAAQTASLTMLLIYLVQWLS